jgi:hypothetical protein
MKESMISIAAKQTPVINRLHDCMTQALSYAAAIRDNAQDDGQAHPHGPGHQLSRRLQQNHCISS